MSFNRINARDLLAARGRPADRNTLDAAARILDDVRERREAAVIEHAQRLGDLRPGDRLIWTRGELVEAAERLTASQRELLQRTADRIRFFALAQRRSLREFDVEVPGGRAGQTVAPVDSAGCYAPGGRFPLPSSVLMTVVTARAAGVRAVWAASPRPAAATLAAAAIAGADGLLAVGGPHAVGAFAYGAGPVPRCDIVVGPGNRWVTAAKQLVYGRAGIDMLAGPSELVVLADDSADARTVAADLLAQAEHDPDAVPILVTTSEELDRDVTGEVERQLVTLPAAQTAKQALANGGVVLVASIDEAVAICDDIAPEHLEVMTRDAREVARRVRHYGALFVGGAAGEVAGDYGIGPNHVLPTAGTARFSGGLSVLTFLRARTWVEIDHPADARGVFADAAALARVEGLEAHARAAETRAGGGR